MDCFQMLHGSPIFEDCIRYDILIRLLDTLFGKHDQIIIDSECENEKNQRLIKDQFAIFHNCYSVPKRVANTQKCVRQTLKHIIDFLNHQYQFKKPIQWVFKKTYQRIGKDVIASSHTQLSLE